MIRSETVHDEIGVSADRDEEVVEIVRDTAGEPAERFHLLRLPQLLLESLPLSQVFDNSNEVNRVALSIAVNADGQIHGHEAPVLATVLFLARVAIPHAGDETLSRLDVLLHIIGVCDRHEVEASELLRRVPQNMAQPAVHTKKPAAQA